jgi:alpha-glucosidase
MSIEAASAYNTANGADAKATPWWRTDVFYQNYMAVFRDGNGDGVGDIPGLTDSLDYLADLGVGAIWLSPCFRSPMLDQGFDISDYTAIEPLFGTIADFRALLAAAHDRGIRILADYVPNHTSDRHAWFIQSRSTRTNPRRDWYIWRDARPDGSPPNNWTSEPGGSAWQWDAATGQYYLHSFLPQQPDLNWRNVEVQEAMLEVLHYWLNVGVDGFRIDVAHMLMKDPDLRDNPPRQHPAENPYDVQHPDFALQEHIYDRMHPDVHRVLRRIRGTVDQYPDKVLIGEIEAMDWPQWATYFGERLDEIHLPFAFRLIETPWRADALAAELAALYLATPEGGWPILALGNHDRSRLATRLPVLQLRIAAMMLMTLRGTPIIFYGDELGLANQDVPRQRQRDHFGLTEGGASRDPIRTPMPWDGSANAGFSSADPDALWLPISQHADRLNVKAQLANPDSLLNLYRALTRLRRASPALRTGAITLQHAIMAETDGCLAYTRHADHDHKLVLLNLTGRAPTVTLPGPSTILLSTGPRHHGDSTVEHVDLGPGEGLVLDLSVHPSC